MAKVAGSVVGAACTDALMTVHVHQAMAIEFAFVSVQLAFLSHVLIHDGAKRRLLYVGDDLGDEITALFDHAHDNRLARRTPSALAARAPTTNVGFVRLNMAS